MSVANTENSAEKSAPDVFVIGAMRVGTTLFYNLMRTQDGISVARMKETDAYLNDKRAAEADSLNKKQYADPQSIWIDISPNYSKRHAFPGVAKRIHAANPDARFIYLVRDPIKRAESHFQHITLESTKPDDQSLSEEALDDVVNTSRYHWQMKPYLDLFPIDRFLFIDFEDFVKEPTAYTDIIGIHIEAPETFSLPETLDKPSNTIDQIGRLPSWWAPLRRSSLGTKIRQRLPRNAMNIIKKVVKSKSDIETLPTLSQDIKDRLVEEGRKEIPKFQKLTGLDLSNWHIHSVST